MSPSPAQPSPVCSTQPSSPSVFKPQLLFYLSISLMGHLLVSWSEHTLIKLLMFKIRSNVRRRDSLICLTSLDMFSKFLEKKQQKRYYINKMRCFQVRTHFFFKLHVCLCAYMCVHGHVEARGQPWVPSSNVISFEIGVSHWPVAHQSG